MNAEIESLRQGSVCFMIMSYERSQFAYCVSCLGMNVIHAEILLCLIFSSAFPNACICFCFKQTYHLSHGYIT